MLGGREAQRAQYNILNSMRGSRSSLWSNANTAYVGFTSNPGKYCIRKSPNAPNDRDFWVDVCQSQIGTVLKIGNGVNDLAFVPGKRSHK